MTPHDPTHPEPRTCEVGTDHARTVEIGPARPLAVIAGPCALESLELSLTVADRLRGLTADLGLPYIFKGSFDKANRTSAGSSRGPGLEQGLEILSNVRERLAVPVTTDLHEPWQAPKVATAVDLLQIPAFLCRQTDLLEAASHAAAQHSRAINIKKGQFLSPAEMAGPVAKCQAAGCHNLLLTERGTFFGYHRLVTDLIGLGDLMQLNPQEPPQHDHTVGPSSGRRGGPPVCYDATHSAQLPGAGNAAGQTTSAGRGERVPLLARAAVATGVDAVFIECHPDPPNAASDRDTMVPLQRMPELLQTLARVADAVGRPNAPQAINRP